MTPEERDRFLEYVMQRAKAAFVQGWRQAADREKEREATRQVKLAVLRSLEEKLGPAPTHFNCRSSLTPFDRAMGRTERSSANTVVSWDGLTDMLGADTVKRIREVS